MFRTHPDNLHRIRPEIQRYRREGLMTRCKLATLFVLIGFSVILIAFIITSDFDVDFSFQFKSKVPIHHGKQRPNGKFSGYEYATDPASDNSVVEETAAEGAMPESMQTSSTPDIMSAVSETEEPNVQDLFDQVTDLFSESTTTESTVSEGAMSEGAMSPETTSPETTSPSPETTSTSPESTSTGSTATFTTTPTSPTPSPTSEPPATSSTNETAETNKTASLNGDDLVDLAVDLVLGPIVDLANDSVTEPQTPDEFPADEETPGIY